MLYKDIVYKIMMVLYKRIDTGSECVTMATGFY